MIALAIAIVILYVGLTQGLDWYWWLVGVLAFAASFTKEGYLGPALLRFVRRLRQRAVRREDDPEALTGVQFEHWVAAHLTREGYDAEVVGGPGDHGADVLAEREGRTIAVQAKRVSGNVGTEAVQDAISGREAHGADEAWVVTTADGVTEQARDLASRTSVRIQRV